MATFKDIEKANSTLSTTNIKGKDYAQVNQRIKAFRQLYPEGYICTNIVELDLTNGIIVMTAEVGYYDANGVSHTLGEGTALEWKNDTKSMVNKTSYVENCETSAVGRALGMIGLGIDVSVASAEEVQTAIDHQDAGEEAPAPVKNPIKKNTGSLTCEDCKKPITTFTDIDGNMFTPLQVAKSTKKQYGRQLCPACAHKEEENKLPFPIPE